MRLSEGRFFDAYDEQTHAQVCVIGPRVARDLFGYEDALGGRVKINDVWFEVGGVLAGADYSASKAAIMCFTKSLARELARFGVHVNCICPGMISTTFHDTFTKDEVRANVAAATPLRREGQAKEVADLAVYLASPASSFITGAGVDINGGMFFS